MTPYCTIKMYIYIICKVKCNFRHICSFCRVLSAPYDVFVASSNCRVENVLLYVKKRVGAPTELTELTKRIVHLLNWQS